MATKEKAMALLLETEARLKNYLSALKENTPFDMAGFDALVKELHEQIADLPNADASTFKDDVTRVMAMLDELANALQKKRADVRGEIDALNKQAQAQAAYRKADTISGS